MPEEHQAPITQPRKKRRWLNMVVSALCVLFLISNIVTLLFWKPWQANIKASDRTITVSGDSTITATPDEYVFSPSYDFTDASSQTALDNMTNKSNDIVAKLKALGVADSSIKTNSNSYSNGGTRIYGPLMPPVPVRQSDGTTTYTLSLTITIDNPDLAQKVQNYLLTTGPTGEVTPQVTFSSAKQKTLQDQGRNQAEQDARAKADQSAKNLGFKVKAVKSVQDGSLVSPIGPFTGGIENSAGGQAANPTLTLQPGQNTINYSVSVVYYIR